MKLNLVNFLRRGRDRIYLVVVCLIFSYLIIEQGLINYQNISTPIDLSGAQEYINALNWLKENSRPNDVVLSEWTQGHQIVALTKRRVVATSKVYPSEAKDVAQRYRDIAYFFIAQDEEEAMKIINKYQVNFIFLRKNFDWPSTISRFKDWSLQDLIQDNQLTPKGRQKTIIGKMFQGEEFDNFKLVYDSLNFLIYQVTNQSPRLSQEEKNLALSLARQALNLYLDKGERLNIDDAELPLRLQKKEPVDVTLWNKGELRGSQIVTKENIFRSIVEAAVLAARDPRFKPVSKKELNTLKIEIFIFGDRINITSVDDLLKKENELLGVKGFYINSNGQEGYYLPSVLNLKEQRLEEFLSNLCREKVKLSEDCWRDANSKILMFDLEDFIESETGQALDIWRAVPLYPIDKLTPANLKISLQQAANWILKMQDPDGFFRQGYDPIIDNFSVSYDLLRNAAASWSLLELYKKIPEQYYLESALKNLNYLSRGNIFNEDRNRLIQVATDRQQPVAALNFTLLALLSAYDATNQKAYLAKAKTIADFLVGLQREDGSFQSYYGEGDKIAKNEIIYDAQALFALSRILNYSSEPSYLNSTKKVSEYLIKRFRDDRLFSKEQSLASNAWLINSFYQFYIITGDRQYANFALEVADWLLDYQRLAGPAVEIGAFNDTTRRFDSIFNSGIGKDSEALVDAYFLAETIGQPKEKYLEALKKSMRWLRQMQYDEENSYFLPPDRLENTLGGFRTNYLQHFSRIDNASHYLIAGLGFLNILQKQNENR